MSGDAISVAGVSKRYPGIQALEDVSLRIGAREVVGLVGENGSGKSTLLRVLAGLVAPDTGQVAVRGERLPPGSFAAAAAAGIGMVFQEQSLLLNLTVAENILLGFEGAAVRYGFYDWKKLRRLARDQLDKLDCAIAPDAIAGDLSFADRQMVELAKVLAIEDRIAAEPVILLDEPTSTLDAREIDRVLRQVERLRERASVVFVSHRLEEVLRISDRVYVMTNGRCVAERKAADLDAAELQRLMLGQHLADEYRAGPARQVSKEIRLSVRNLCRERSYEDVSFDLRAGEICGLAGVQGSGRENVCRAVFGAEVPDEGEIVIDGAAVRLAGPADAVARGIGYVPAERRVEGIVPGMSVCENMTLAHIEVACRGWLMRGRQEHDHVSSWVARLNIRTPSNHTLTGQLSGGNQQKVVLAKWLIGERPRLLVLDHPLRGLDVGAKAEIFARVRELAESGIAILLIADTLEELIALSDNIIVMRDGRITARFAVAGGKPAPIDILENMI